ncbi:hypothetical protein GLOTRDRAFT_124981 [Gloeophyllum trabeum ATCC 11539]|uniref:Uncharacterized protein n=1 Tax=Gloeophyllum trabeum (strain ATCC 11539 / FP-39264 / Madison 617) TaxID=670483 RepID=S7S5J0_GLOTA|nr:uncharacterized protein GLOTRDRAFT_124981 [Gloeophyllum trabeum ATCC 11539]EPQ61254.1 hypothetical protein GLOTRDRAFT_124981 [Gloeophyllum trabeum ATCC 11539]
MAQVPIDEAHALATWLSSIFLGALIVLYCACVWVLVYKADRMGPVNMPMLFAATAMTVVAMVHNAVSVQRNVQAFFGHVDGNAVKYFILSSNFPNLFQSTLFVIQVLIGDSMLIYRCYIVYRRDWRIVVPPILMFLGTVGELSKFTAVSEFSVVDARTVTNETYFGSDVQPWSTGMKVVSMVQNIFCSFAIALRIWWIGRHGGSKVYWRSIELILESGIIYFLVVLILLILNITKQNTYAILYYVLVPVIGIIFTGIIIRVGLRESSTVNYDSTSIAADPNPALRITFADPTTSDTFYPGVHGPKARRTKRVVRKEVSTSSMGSHLSPQSSFAEKDDHDDSHEEAIAVEPREEDRAPCLELGF